MQRGQTKPPGQRARRTASAQAGTLIGTGTLLTTDDLTRVQVGSSVLEFLDLSTSKGQSWTTALANYGSYGFTVAYVLRPM